MDSGNRKAHLPLPEVDQSPFRFRQGCSVSAGSVEGRRTANRKAHPTLFGRGGFVSAAHIERNRTADGGS